MMDSDLTIHDLAEGSLLVEYPGLTELEANERALAAAAMLDRERPRGCLGSVPGARTLYVEFDPETADRTALANLIGASEVRSGFTPRRTHTIPVVYGADAGPDLPELARQANLSPEEFARRHARASYRVAFLGFAPGFAYLTGLPAELQAPRLATPRTRVPAGTVAIGGPYTGIYPGETPGGWRLIGRTDVVLFDPGADPPSRLLPGDSVRFESAAQVGPAPIPAAAHGESAGRPEGVAVFRVVAPGVFSSIQGAPRHDWLRAGVPPGGAMDRAALSRGNQRVGNSPEAAALEMTLVGAELEATAAATVCLSGAEPSAAVNAGSVAPGELVTLRRGDRIAIARILDGMRSYLCVAGGLWQPSRPRVAPRLSKGDVLFSLPSAPPVSASPPRARSPRGAPPKDPAVVRVVLGPHRHHYTEEGFATFLSSVYRVSAASDRRGVRLEGPSIGLAGPPDIPPEGTPLGGIQVAGDGLPIVLGPDRPVTGGYCRIATIVRDDFPIVAQAAPGTLLRFARVDLPLREPPE
jgi:KipI family sensor histidine kinase inhibitor